MKEDALSRTDLYERSAMAIFLSSIVYPIPVIAAMAIVSGGLPWDIYLIIGYLFAAVIGMLLCVSAGFATHFVLVQKDKTRLYHYLLAGTVTAWFLLCLYVLSNYKSTDLLTGSEVLGIASTFGFSGFCLAGFFWLFYYRKMERRFGRLDIFFLVIAIASIAGMGWESAYKRHQDKEHLKAKRAWIVEMPIPEFDQVSGPAPLTIAMLRPESWPEQPEDCWTSYFPPLTKRPIYHQKQYVVWEELNPLDLNSIETIPTNFEGEHVYASEHEKYCFWTKSHTYTEPGRYKIKLYTDYDRFTDQKQDPDHTIEVVVTAPDSSRLK